MPLAGVSGWSLELHKDQRHDRIGRQIVPPGAVCARTNLPVKYGVRAQRVSYRGGASVSTPFPYDASYDHNFCISQENARSLTKVREYGLAAVAPEPVTSM